MSNVIPFPIKSKKIPKVSESKPLNEFLKSLKANGDFIRVIESNKLNQDFSGWDIKTVTKRSWGFGMRNIDGFGWNITNCFSLDHAYVVVLE